jgi:hypothetical protein
MVRLVSLAHHGAEQGNILKISRVEASWFDSFHSLTMVLSKAIF